MCVRTCIDFSNTQRFFPPTPVLFIRSCISGLLQSTELTLWVHGHEHRSGSSGADVSRSTVSSSSSSSRQTRPLLNGKLLCVRGTSVLNPPPTPSHASSSSNGTNGGSRGGPPDRPINEPQTVPSPSTVVLPGRLSVRT